MSKNARFYFALLGLNAFVLVLRVLRSSILSSTRSKFCDQNRVSSFSKIFTSRLFKASTIHNYGKDDGCSFSQ